MQCVAFSPRCPACIQRAMSHGCLSLPATALVRNRANAKGRYGTHGPLKAIKPARGSHGLSLQSASSPSDASAPKAPAEAEKAPAEAEKAPVEKPSSPGGPGGPGAQTDNSVPVPAKVTPNVVPESTPSRSYFPSAAPSGTVSGKVANTTSTSIVPMTAGAAGTSFSAFAAITVAIFVVVVVS